MPSLRSLSLSKLYYPYQIPTLVNACLTQMKFLTYLELAVPVWPSRTIAFELETTNDDNTKRRNKDDIHLFLQRNTILGNLMVKKTFQAEMMKVKGFASHLRIWF
jgi:hypothetical protein